MGMGLGLGMSMGMGRGREMVIIGCNDVATLECMSERQKETVKHHDSIGTNLA
jgi:hypothetical protein